MEALRRELLRTPEHPRSMMHPAVLSFRAGLALDFVVHAKHDWSRAVRKIRPYPKPFETVRLFAKDGVELSAWSTGNHIQSRFGVVVVPGLFATKDDHQHRGRAIHIQREWNVPVVCLDLRAFGESKGIATAGWKERWDVIAAVDHLEEVAGCEKVLLVGESMGGAAVLNAMAQMGQDGDERLLGGVTISAFVDALDAVTHISSEPPKGDAFETYYQAFRGMLRRTTGGGYESFLEFMSDVARQEGLAPKAFLKRASPKKHLHEITSPVLLLHASDDPIIPVRHARRIERYAATQPMLIPVITTWGEHAGFEAMDPVWFWSILDRFWEYLSHPARQPTSSTTPS